MLGYALDDQLLYADFFVRILCLISILKNGFLGIFIDSGINLQRAFAVAGKGNNDIANLSIAICPDNHMEWIQRRDRGQNREQIS